MGGFRTLLTSILRPEISPHIQLFLQVTLVAQSKVLVFVLMESHNRQPREGDVWWHMQSNHKHNKLHLAAKNGNVQQAEEALETGIDINALHHDGSSGFQILHIASTKGHVNIIRCLLANGADVNGRDVHPDGNSTPLFAAVSHTRVEATRALLHAGADINGRGRQDGTPLHFVLGRETEVKPNHIKLISLLLGHAIDINAQAPKWGVRW